MINENDHRSRHCPMLGHELTFAYCRQPGVSVPCRRIFDCWFETFDIRDFIASHYDQATIDAMTMPQQSRLQTLGAIIEQARRNSQIH